MLAYVALCEGAEVVVGKTYSAKSSYRGSRGVLTSPLSTLHAPFPQGWQPAHLQEVEVRQATGYERIAGGKMARQTRRER